VSNRREVWITGVGLLTSLGEGLELNWKGLAAPAAAVFDDQTFAPFIVHPLAPVSFEKQIPKKGDQRQMELWQRIGVYAAGLALADAGIAGKPEILDHTDMIVAASSGERDLALDTAILNKIKQGEKPEAVLNEQLMTGLRPTLFLAQLPNLLGGNISIVHGVTGSSRTFMGEESAATDALRVAHSRVAAGQSEVSLVGGSYHGARWDMILIMELAHAMLRTPFAPVWERGGRGGVALACLGAFLVLESPDHATARGAKAVAKLSAVTSGRNARKPGDIEATLRRQWAALAPLMRAPEAAIISGTTGNDPAMTAERRFLEETGLAVRSTGTHFGHGAEAQLFANVAIASETLRRDAMIAPAGSADVGEKPASLRQVAVTSVGTWRGEGLALVERAD
jgi:3-oxoacyl-[acyl-carrier-protein] synthase II